MAMDTDDAEADVADDNREAMTTDDAEADAADDNEEATAHLNTYPHAKIQEMLMRVQAMRAVLATRVETRARDHAAWAYREADSDSDCHHAAKWYTDFVDNYLRDQAASASANATASREADSDSDDSANWDVDFIDNFLRDQRRAKAAGASANASATADAHSNDDEACHAEAYYAIGSRALN